MTDIMPEWVNVGQHETGQPINQYFLDNPDMVMGELKEVSGPFGPELTCVPNEDTTLAELLDDAIQNIHASITEYEFDDISNDEEITIPADPNVRNFSFTVVDGDVYFRENSLMRKVELNTTAENRVKGMIELRDCVRTLIEYQTENYSDDEIKAQQAKLNTLYDNYTKKIRTYQFPWQFSCFFGGQQLFSALFIRGIGRVRRTRTQSGYVYKTDYPCKARGDKG